MVGVSSYNEDYPHNAVDAFHLYFSYLSHVTLINLQRDEENVINET